MAKSIKSTSERKKQLNKNEENLTKMTKAIEKPAGPINIPDQKSSKKDYLYNENGNLIWNGINLTQIADGSSKWSHDDGSNAIYRLGQVGIGTQSPRSELDVVGTITTDGIKISTINGIAKIENGEFGGNATLNDLQDVFVENAQIVLIFICFCDIIEL